MCANNFDGYIGINLMGFIDDQYVVTLEVEARHHNPTGIVHGGVLCTMLDTAMAKAFFETLPKEKQSGAALELKINFLRPTVTGKLTAFGKLVNPTLRTAFVEGYILNESGKLVAKATATLILSAMVTGERNSAKEN
jgi:uncharacterized protein (TIGR00369 family)